MPSPNDKRVYGLLRREATMSPRAWKLATAEPDTLSVSKPTSCLKSL